MTLRTAVGHPETGYNFVEDQWNLGLDRTPANLFESYEGVTAEQVASSVEGMQLDYSYLLAPSEVPAPSEPEISR